MTSKRRDHDYYPTTPDCTVALLTWYRANRRALGLPTLSRVLDPCAGPGLLLEQFESLGVMGDVTPETFGLELQQTFAGELASRVDHYHICDALETPWPAGHNVGTNVPFDIGRDFVERIIDYIRESLTAAYVVLPTLWMLCDERCDVEPPRFRVDLPWRAGFDGGGGGAKYNVSWWIWTEEPAETTQVWVQPRPTAVPQWMVEDHKRLALSVDPTAMVYPQLGLGL